MAGKAERLRDFMTRIKASPIDRVPSAKEWEELIDEAGFTADDVDLLAKQVKGHQNRARQAAASGDEETLVFEALQGMLLAPLESDFAREVALLTAKTAPTVEGLADLRLRLKAAGSSRSGTRKNLVILVVAALALLLVVATAVTVLMLQPGGSAGAELAPPKVEAVTRDLPFTLETRGVKTSLAIQKSQLQVYAEAAVIEIRARISIPDDRITAWAGSLLALDADGKALGSRPVELLNSREAPLEPGEAVEFFQQLDAQDWKERVVSLVFQTVEIAATPAVAPQRTALKVAGLERLTKGYQFVVSLVQSEWKERFATKVNESKLEIRNTGLKAFEALTFRLEWTLADGEVLKVQMLKPVSENRALLPSGVLVTLTNQAVFESEVFFWPEGSPPQPVIRLESWK